MRSSDKHCIPKPFGKAVIIFGEPFRIDQCSTEEEQQVWADKIADALNKMDAEAEAVLLGKEKQDVRAV
jgi:lysophospholipid acyltransferase (LPLAT)-like uncharacterized protein